MNRMLTVLIVVCFALATAGCAASPFGRLEVYPNPARTIANIAWAGMQEGDVLAVSSMTGELVFSTTLGSPSGTLCLDVSSYAAGVYIVSAGQLTQRLIVAH